MDNNFYYSPEKFALTPVGEIDWSDGNYQFDLTVVYLRLDGRFVYAEDSGCSCPVPFDGQGCDDLTVCKPGELQAHLEQRNKDQDRYGDDRSAEIADLMHRVMNPTAA